VGFEFAVRVSLYPPVEVPKETLKLKKALKMNI